VVAVSLGLDDAACIAAEITDDLIELRGRDENGHGAGVPGTGRKEQQDIGGRELCTP
jgi:hypothetical protein